MKIMKVDIIRYGDNGNASLGGIYINNILRCGDVADEHRNIKVKGETRIPNGKYLLGLRRAGGFHERYLKKYGKDFHKGMICIYNSDNWVLKTSRMVFQYVLFHTGNTEKHTDACCLPNYVLDFQNYRGQRSEAAYLDIYPEIRDSIIDWEKGNSSQPTIQFSDVKSVLI